MSDTITSTEPTANTTAQQLSLHPGDILLHLIVTLLAPMFVGVSGGDIHLARMAALETVTAYRTRNHADLIAIAQIIACGLAALGSISLSMADDISVSMALRLRGNANALGRTAEQHRRAIRDSQVGQVMPCQPREEADPSPRSEPVDAAYEAAVVADVARTRQLLAEAQATRTEPRPAGRTMAEPAGGIGSAPDTAAAVDAASMIQQQRQAMWGAAMVDVAAEYTASLPSLPPAQRRAASMRAAALSTTANDLICGLVAPPLNPRAPDPLPRPKAA